MGLENLQKAVGSTSSKKRIGRGRGTGWGKTDGKGMKGQKARTGFNEKRGFEGGQQPLQRRLPKVGFVSKIEKPYVINLAKFPAIKELDEINLDSLKTVHKFSNNIKKVKIIGAGAAELASKIKDENITTSGSK